MSQKTIILIGGPTASGKSALAMKLARQRNGNIINADAMQIYAGLPILTAQPEPADRAEIPHLLYETTDPSEASSAGKWLIQARAAIAQTLEQGRTPIIVGGTGLHFEALRGGLADIPPIPNEARRKAQDLYDEIGEKAFRAALSNQDPDSAARIARNDRQRLIRAYEVVLHTGQPLGEWQKAAAQTDALRDYKTETHLLLPPREALYTACDNRFLSMLERGALQEVQALTARQLSPALPAMKILGVRELAATLSGELSLATATTKAQQSTRNYAKRQMTWFRNRWGNVEASTALT